MMLAMDKKKLILVFKMIVVPAFWTTVKYLSLSFL